MRKKNSNGSAWKMIRKLMMNIHLWMGLASGLIVIVVCFSGTVYVFNQELVEWSSPHLYKVEYNQTMNRIPADSLIEKVALASGGKVTSISIPAALNKSYQFNVRKEGDNSKRGIGYMVNPYTGDILGNTKEKSAMRTLMGNMFSLHRWLLLDKIEQPVLRSKTNLELGRMINGWATILFTLGCITGLVIWFPNRVKAWKQGLKIKWGGGWKRLTHDLHNTLAFYSLFFLLLMGLTGPQWSFKWYRTGMQKMLGTYKENVTPGKGGEMSKPKANKEDEVHTIQIAGLLASADAVLPYKGDYLIQLPAEASPEVNISKSKIGFFAPAAADRLTLHAGNGAVLKRDIFKEKPFNERVAGSIKAIHLGTVYGNFTKWLYFFTCLIATSLPVTGTMIWLNKVKKRRRKTINQNVTTLQYNFR